MQVVCAHCHAVVAVEDVGSAVSRSGVQCSRCGGAIDLQAPLAEGAETTWLLQTEQGQAGPFTASHMALMFDRGRVDWGSRVWRAGLKDWRAARRDPELVTALASARGTSWDTQRVGEHMSLLSEPPGELAPGSRESAAAAEPMSSSRESAPAARSLTSSSREAVSSSREAPVTRGLAAGAREAAVVREPTPGAREAAATRELAASVREAPVAREQASARGPARAEQPWSQPAAPAAEPTFADVLRSAPSIVTTLPALEAEAVRPAAPRTSGLYGWLPSPRSMLLVAIAAFGSGVLVAAFWGRFVERAHVRASTIVVAAPRRGVDPVAPPAQGAVQVPASALQAASTAPESAAAAAPQAPSAVAPALVAIAGEASSSPLVPGSTPGPAAPEPGSAAPQSAATQAPLREVPEPREVAQEFKRIAGEVRRCVPGAGRGVDVEVFFAGASGQVAGVNLHTSRLTPGGVECITQALRQLRVAPFRSAEHKLRHRFAF